MKINSENARFVMILVLVFAYFSAWAVVKPPFTSPDEGTHAVRAYSVTRVPWRTPSPGPQVEINTRFLNGLPTHTAFFGTIGQASARPLTAAEITELKQVKWDSPASWHVTRYANQAYAYPALYYLAAFAFGQGVTEVFQLSPYDSFYAYRLVTAWLAALLWALVYRELGHVSRFRTPLFALVLLNPMLAFMSSSINPDAVLYPLVILTIVYAYQTMGGLPRAYRLFAALCAAALIKPTALVVFPVLAVPVAWQFVTHTRFRRSLALATGSAVATVVLAFYAWAPGFVPPLTVGVHSVMAPMAHPLREYLHQTNFKFLLDSYWGVLGWLDVFIAPRWYLMLYALVAVNAVWVAVHWRAWSSDNGFAPFAFGFAVLFTLGTFSVGYILFPTHGLVLQGRYFLPAALGFAMIIAHDGRWLRHALLAGLAIFNVSLFARASEFYYAGDWTRLVHALPFNAAT